MSPNLAMSSGNERLEYVHKQMAGKNWENLKILDVGCGRGFVCEYFASLKAQVTGTDIVPLTEKPKNWQFATADLDQENWPEAFGPNPAFDLILVFDVLEHISSPWRLLHSFKKIMSIEAKLLLSTPNISSWERHRSPTTWSGASDPQHKHLFNAYSLSFLLERAGFEVINKEAPIRKLGALNKFIPLLGGQLQFTAKPKLT